MLRRGIFVTVLLIVAAGCGPLIGMLVDNQSGGAAVSSGGVTDYASLVDSLRAAGLRVEPAGEVDQPFFSVSGLVFSVPGGDVQVFEYDSNEAAQADAGQIAPDGNPIGPTMITWIAPPHFYRAGRLLVLYLGSDSQVMAALEATLGPQFAGQ